MLGTILAGNHSYQSRNGISSIVPQDRAPVTV